MNGWHRFHRTYNTLNESLAQACSRMAAAYLQTH